MVHLPSIRCRTCGEQEDTKPKMTVKQLAPGTDYFRGRLAQQSSSFTQYPSRILLVGNDITYYVLWMFSKMGLIWDMRPVPKDVLEDR